MIQPSQPQFEIQSELLDARARVTVLGELDIATVPSYEEELRALLARAPKGLLIDLSGLTFIDSSGLNLFIALNNRASEEGWTLALTRPPEHARAVFTITGAETYLPFKDDPGSR